MNLQLRAPPVLEAYYLFPDVVQHLRNPITIIRELSREFEVVRWWARIREERGAGAARRRHLRSRSEEVAEKLGYGVESQVGQVCEDDSWVIECRETVEGPRSYTCGRGKARLMRLTRQGSVPLVLLPYWESPGTIALRYDQAFEGQQRCCLRCRVATYSKL